MSLIRRLHEKNARIFFQGDDAGQRVESLVTSAALSNCRKGKGFSKILEMSVTSLKSKLHVRVEAGGSSTESISNCPYEMQRLLHDQGLDYAFGRKDHLTLDRVEESNSEQVVYEQIGELRATLDGIILSWAEDRSS